LLEGWAHPLLFESRGGTIMYPSDRINSHKNVTVPRKFNGESYIDPNLTRGADLAKGMLAIPLCGSLEGLTEIGRSLQGVELATLARFDTIVVNTVNSQYRIFLLDPENGRALLEGGRQIHAVEARVVGSSFGGSILRTGWVGVGLRMEACANDKYIRTSPVQSLWIERQTSIEAA
jgi:hypothetical protein